MGEQETEILRIGCKNNRMNGLVETIDFEIGYGKNKIIGLIQIKDYQTPTNNPQLSTSQRTALHKPTNERKNKSRTRSQYKAQHKNTKKEQKGKHSITPYRQHANQ